MQFCGVRQKRGSGRVVVGCKANAGTRGKVCGRKKIVNVAPKKRAALDGSPVNVFIQTPRTLRIVVFYFYFIH